MCVPGRSRNSHYAVVTLRGTEAFFFALFLNDFAKVIIA
jgi:hypothetical protein